MISSGPSIVTSGLVLYLDAGNRESYSGSGTSWTDLSGIDNNGTISGGITFNSSNLGYFSFDGIDDWVTVPPGPNFAYGTGDYTVEAWVRPFSSLAGAGYVIYSQAVSGTNYFIMGVGSSASPTTYFISTPSGGGTTLTGPNYNVGVWNHIVFTRRSGVIYSYVNAVAGNTQSNTTNLSNTTYVPTIGDETHHGNADAFKGDIGVVRVYKGRGLTPQEVNQNFVALRGRYGLG